jgi:hypothetical protein
MTHLRWDGGIFWFKFFSAELWEGLPTARSARKKALSSSNAINSHLQWWDVVLFRIT